MADSFIPDETDSFVPDEPAQSFPILQTAIPAIMGSSPMALATQLSNQIPATPENVMAVARPVLEQGGMMGGAAAGTVAAPGIGTVVGAGLGQGTGRVGADVLQSYLNNQPMPNNLQMLQRFGTGAAVGTGSELTGMGIAKGVSAFGKYAAVPMMKHALGFSKRFLGTPEARQAADEAAQVALQKNVMPMMGSPEGAAENLENIKQGTGQELGTMRSSVGPQPVDQVFDSLEQLRNKLTQGGAVGGEWDALHSTINDAQATIIGLQRTGTPLGEIDVNKMVAAKNAITDGINYLKKNATPSTAKKIASSIEDGIENILEANGADMSKYAELKKVYGGSSNALKALNNELSSQEGNQLVNPSSLMLGAGAVASGNPMEAIGAMGGVEFAKRRGMGILANAANFAANQYPLLKNLFSLGLSSEANKLQANQ